MTPIESIYEIQATVLDLKKYLSDKRSVVYHKAYERYEKLVNRYIREKFNVTGVETCSIGFDDVDYFLELLKTTADDYYNMD